MLRSDIDLRFEKLWQQSLADSGCTETEIAKAMGVSRHTVSNWLNGITCPTQRQGFEWFLKLGLQPLPYYLQLLYPSEFDGILTADDKQIEDALHAFISGLTSDERRKLLYCCYGEHGSSPHAVLELVTAYLHTPFRDRINIANSVVLNYTIADSMGTLVKAEETKPNINILRLAIRRCTQAILKGHNNYTAILNRLPPQENFSKIMGDERGTF